MKSLRFLLSTAMLTFVIGSCRASELQSLAQRYRGALTERARIDVAIDAIDKRIICLGCPIANVDAIFATDFARLRGARLIRKSVYGAEVYFEEAPSASGEPSVPRISQAPSEVGTGGWRLEIDFRPSGNIVNYRLTNVDKTAI